MARTFGIDALKRYIPLKTDRIQALPVAILAVFVALIVSRPLGMTLQARYTVDPELGGLRVTSIREVSPSPVTRFFQLLLGQAKNDQTHAFRVETIG